jgi:hypothetical protein
MRPRPKMLGAKTAVTVYEGGVVVGVKAAMSAIGTKRTWGKCPMGTFGEPV